MAKTSKAKRTRQNNVKKATAFRKVTVEDVPEMEEESNSPRQPTPPVPSEPLPPIENTPKPHAVPAPNPWNLDLGEELPYANNSIPLDDTCQKDPEDRLIGSKGELHVFAQFLQDAQVAAQAAEHAQDQEHTIETGRKRHRGPYTGNAKRTKQRHLATGRGMRKNGFLSIGDFMKLKQQERATREQSAVTVDGDSGLAEVAREDKMVDLTQEGN